MPAMRLSRRSEYALRVLVDLARHGSTCPVPLAILAGRNDLPPKFLEQILSRLKRAGIVRTTLGARGGYALAVDPAEVTVGGIVRLIDGGLGPVACVEPSSTEVCTCPTPADCSVRSLMGEVRDAILAVLERETLAALAARDGQAEPLPALAAVAS
jgi:Rrf2 family transcriptional regulator, cysteine metabolism repressor